MQPKSTRPLKVYIRFLRMKLNAFLNFAVGPVITNPAPRQPEQFDPLILFSRRAIKRKIYQSMKK